MQADRALHDREEIDTAEALLLQQRKQALKEIESGSVDALHRLIELGLWPQAEAHIARLDTASAATWLASAHLALRNHRYAQAQALVERVLGEEPSNRRARQLLMELDIQAWRLGEAAREAEALLEANPKDAAAAVVLGRIALLGRDYAGAMDWARKAQRFDSRLAEAFALQAEVLFWEQRLVEAEAALRDALRKDPLDPDTRFSYGYAIWRRVDATQLPLMARNWQLALQVDPLHYLTHWHFGNGHTHLTYVDYAHPSDDEVREQLAEADALLAKGALRDALDSAEATQREAPESVLPEMARGSYYYMLHKHDGTPRPERLDSAQAHFERVLGRKPHYGPAHNALAAVIKQRQFAFLDAYPDLERALTETPVPEPGSVFYDVFRDAEAYPGDRVRRMIAQQIGPSRVYLEMIRKFDSNFAIPPLHHDLAMAMGNTWFRTQTTFDNRQWMDIRGVGSGATGIEYLERGAHLERNVLAHEYAHLYHGRILTDAEDRAIRALYHEAMRQGRTLDYYAANNESEFFAQGYAGFLAEEKVHPLNHKSMNTRAYIAERDPDYYAFLEALLGRQTAHLEGETGLLDENWAQTYLSLARRERGRGNSDLARAYLDTSLSHAAAYIPTHLELADLEAEQGNVDAAFERLDAAEALDPAYAPAHVARAGVLHRQAVQGERTFEESMQAQRLAFDRAERLEDDLAERARNNRVLRERLRAYARHEQALQVAERYLAEAPTLSTYLRDRLEETQAFAHNMRSRLGRHQDAVVFFEQLVAQNPQNFSYRATYADVLARSGEREQAITVLEAGERILASAGRTDTGLTLRLALLHAQAGRAEESARRLEALEADGIDDLPTGHSLMLAGVHLGLGDAQGTREQLDGLEPRLLPEDAAQRDYLLGRVHELDGETASAAAAYRAALQTNPHHLEARTALETLEGSTHAAGATGAM